MNHVGAPNGGEHDEPAPASRVDSEDAKESLREAARQRDQQRYVLRLYVTGATRASSLAIERVRAVCEKELQGRYTLEVIDIYQVPALAKGEQIIATPTLVKVLPTPLRRYIGNLANVERVLFGVDLREARP